MTWSEKGLISRRSAGSEDSPRARDSRPPSSSTHIPIDLAAHWWAGDLKVASVETFGEEGTAVGGSALTCHTFNHGPVTAGTLVVFVSIDGLEPLACSL